MCIYIYIFSFKYLLFSVSVCICSVRLCHLSTHTLRGEEGVRFHGAVGRDGLEPLDVLRPLQEKLANEPMCVHSQNK